MKPIEFIVSYLRKEASPAEQELVRNALKVMETPPIVAETIVQNLLTTSMKLYDGNNRLNVVKHVKDITSWGLKECKDWCEIHIFPFKTTNYGQ